MTRPIRLAFVGVVLIHREGVIGRDRASDQASSPNQPRRATAFTASSTGTIEKASATVRSQSVAVKLNVPNSG